MKILQRYVYGEVLRAFVLALLTMTVIFVLFMVAAEAIRSRLLSPGDVLHLVPYVIPSTLPYTIPVSLLFAVTVVYGRIAGDNEIIAVKSAGLSVMTVIWPAIFLAACLSGLLLHVSHGWIPRSAHRAKLVLFKDVEDTFYKFLKRDKAFDNPLWPFSIKVRDVDGRIMKDATFNKRAKGKDDSDIYSATIQAKQARLHFDFAASVAHVYLDHAEVQNYGTDDKNNDGKLDKDDDVALVNDRTFDVPLPDKSQVTMQRAVQEYPNDEINVELAKAQERLGIDCKKQAITVGFQCATGKFDQIKWGEVQHVLIDQTFYQRRVNELETEKQLRTAMAFGSLLFVILGAPVGILFAKRDFLSAFMTCFLPIIGAYYPFMLLGQNLGREGQLDPTLALWIGNVILAVGAGLVYPRIIKF